MADLIRVLIAFVPTEDSSSEVFTEFNPEDFIFDSVRAVWEQPCWIVIGTHFRAISAPAKARFRLPLKFEFRVDPFARKPADEQLNRQYWSMYDHTQSLGALPWRNFFWERMEAYQSALNDTNNLIMPPLRFVPRSGFRTGRLDEVLGQDPDTMVIYVAEDTNSYGHDIYTLRIHSSLWHYSPGQSYLWYQKTLPWTLHPEDVLPWFHATIAKLPRNRRPQDVSLWDEALVRAEPDLAHSQGDAHTEWKNRSKLVLVFGTREQAGYAALYHLERPRIRSVLRKEAEISIRASSLIHMRKTSKNCGGLFI